MTVIREQSVSRQLPAAGGRQTSQSRQVRRRSGVPQQSRAPGLRCGEVQSYFRAVIQSNACLPLGALDHLDHVRQALQEVQKCCAAGWARCCDDVQTADDELAHASRGAGYFHLPGRQLRIAQQLDGQTSDFPGWFEAHRTHRIAQPWQLG